MAIVNHLDAPVKPYLVYAGSDYYPCAGAGDLRCSADTMSEAEAAIEFYREELDGFGWWHIVDHATMVTLKQGNYDCAQ